MPTKQGLDTSVAITATGLASLANGSAYELGAVDNGTNKYFDFDLTIKVKLATGSPSDGVYIYVAMSEDGTVWNDNATGSAGALTMRSPTNLLLVGCIATPDSGALTYSKVFKGIFNNSAPRKFSPIVVNRSALGFDTTGANFGASYTGKYLG